MKKIFTFVQFLLLLMAPQAVRCQEVLTVYENATATSTQVPVNGGWTDAYLKCEFVIPSDQLEDMDGGTISQMTFYLTTPAGAAWVGTFQVFLMEVDNTTISTYYGPNNATVVYEGTLDATQSTMVVEFNDSYTYQGGNLLIGVYQIVEGNYKSATFAGESITGASVQGYSSSSLDAVTVNQRNFIPKTTFTYTSTGGGPVCEKPAGITVGNITSNSAVVTWEGTGGPFNLQYKASSATDWTEVNGLSDLSYNLTSLVSNTNYTVRIQQVCNENTSNWKSAYFTTPIGIPFVEPFDATNAPTGWTQYTGLLSNVLNGTALNPATSWSFGSRNGVFDSHAFINVYGTGCQRWLVSPFLLMEANVELSFDMALTAYSGTLGTPKTNGSDDKFVVLITTDGGNTWEILRQWDNAGSEYVYNNIPCSAEGESVAIDLSSYAGQNIAIAFYGESTQTNADNNLHIDNVRIDYSNVLSCKRPTGLSATDVAVTTATLSWTESGGASAWQVCLNEDTTNLINVASNPYTLTDLTPETAYTVKMRASCGDTASNWSNTISFTTPSCPAPVFLDTAVCASELPLTWHGHTFTEFGSHTMTLTTSEGCDSVVTLRVSDLTYHSNLLSDDFNDGVIDPQKWSYTGNAVVEEDGQLKLYQNVTDQDVHLRSVDLDVPANGKVTMDRKFMVHRSDNSYYGNYFYGNSRFYLNGGTDYVGLQYNYTTYEGWYGTYLIYNVNGNENRVRLCDATFDTWLTEQVEIDFFAGTLSYYLDTLVATVSIPGLSTQTVDYFNVFFNPGGWWTGHQHFIDNVDIYGGIGVVRTSPASDVAYTTATCGGEVITNECNAYTAIGVCWSMNHKPTPADAHTTDGTGAGTFTSAITGLTEGTTYYVRAYAVNSTDTVYGQEVSFTTCRTFTSEFADVICESALPYVWNGESYNESGDYEQTFLTAANCDSVVTLHLTVHPELAVSITGATHVVIGESTTLTASGADTYTWAANGVSIGSDDSVTVSPEETTTYSVTGYLNRTNLVANGDFEQGNTGFTTGYSYVNDGSYGHYYIGHNNQEMWSWDDMAFSDHTTGDGLWMMVDAYSNRNVWSQTVAVTPNTEYVFSAWFLTDNIANVRFEINDQQGEIFTTPQQRGVWEQQRFVWNSGSNTSATLKIITGSASSSGNDFGIDDISFSELTCESTESFTVVVCPAPVTIDTAVCPSELPLTWHGHTFEEYGSFTDTLTTANGCDSVVTLIVKTPFYMLSDDFNDGVIDPEKWTYTGNAVVEEGGQLKLYENVTDQPPHLLTVDLNVPANGKVTVDRKFMVHRANDYFYAYYSFNLNGGADYVGLGYYYTTYDGWYGTYLFYKLNGMENVERVRICDATFDSWITEHVDLDFTAGTLSYYLDTLVTTVSIPGLSDQTVDYFNVEFRPDGWWTGHQHFMDYVEIQGGMSLVRTAPASDVAYTTATCGGEVAPNECDAYTAAGVCWSTSHNPTLVNAHTTDGTGAGTFTSAITGLAEGTTYYVRAYAVNSTDTVYGQEVSFTTCRHFTSEFEVTICENALPYVWNEVSYSESGNYTQTFTTAANCDSMVTLHLTVLPPPAIEIARVAGHSATVCEGSSTAVEAIVTGGYGEVTSYQWWENGMMSPDGANAVLNIENLTPGANGLYTVEVAQTGVGCYHSASVALDTIMTVYPQFAVSVSGPASVCDNGILMLTATMENVSNDDELAYQWYGVPVAISGANDATYTSDNLQAGSYDYFVAVTGNVSGCYAESEPVHVDILPTYHTTLYDTTCQGFEFDFFGQSLTESGPYTHTLQATNGCDSVITLHLEVLPKPTVEIARVAGYPETVCEGSATAIEAVVTDGYGEIVSYQWYKNNIILPNETNTVLNIENLPAGADDLYSFEVVQTGKGCTNTASAALNTLVTVYPQFTTSVSGPASVCENGILTLTATVDNASEDDVLMYQWFSLSSGTSNAISEATTTVYSPADLQAGSYDYQVEVNGTVSGCNAMSTPIHVDILPIYSTALFDTICDGGNYEFFGETLTETGPYTHTLQAANGCDSIITLHLTVHPLPAATFISETICEKVLPYVWNGIPYSESGDYTQTLPNVNNCDSVVTLHLTVLPSLVGELTTMTPIADETVSDYPIHFTWNAVENASGYDLYVWPVGEPQPQQPTVSQIHETQHIIAELPNNTGYQWLVMAYNDCDTATSTVRAFSVNVTPVLTVTSANPVDFGEVPFKSTRSVSFYVNGNALGIPITYQLTGADASLFSLAPTNNWDSLHGGKMKLTFNPTIPQSEYTAQMTFQSGSLVETVPVMGALSDYYTFTTYVDSNIYAMGSEIPIHGQVTDPLDEPIAGVNVEVYVKVMEYVRTIPATSDANGQFTVTFTPQHSEAGYYTVGSRKAGGNSTAEHDEFNIPGMMRVTSDWILWNPTLDQPDTGVIAVRNRSQIPLTNIQVTPSSLPNGCTVQFLPLNLAGMATGELQYIVSGTATSTGVNYEEVPLNAVSAEGAAMDFSAWYYCIPQRADLEVLPKSLVTTMTRGKSKVVDFLIYNNGTGSTGNIIVSLPPLPWMSVVGGDTLPSLAAHDSAYVSIRLSADSETELVRYTGNFAILCERGESVGIPYNITAVSDSTGRLEVDVTDEYAWNTNGGHGPHLAGANVTVKGYYSLDTVATGVTDENGLFVADNLPEGWYRLIIRASRHAEYQNYLYITAGDTNRQDVFMPFQAITYYWDVVPTEIEDVYTYELNVEFETHVPKPVVTMDIDRTLPLLEECEMGEFNVLATNHGLVAAMDVAVVVPQSDYFVFTPLVSHIDSLPALTTYTIPVIYQRKDCAESANLMFASNVPTKAQTKAPDYYDGITCDKNMFNLTYWYFCRVTHWETVISGDVKYEMTQEICGDTSKPSVSVPQPSPSPDITNITIVDCQDIVINPDWVRNYPYVNLPNLTGWEPGIHYDTAEIPDYLKVCDPNLTPCQNALNGLLELIPVISLSVDSDNTIQFNMSETMKKLSIEAAKEAIKELLEVTGAAATGVGSVVAILETAKKVWDICDATIGNWANIRTCLESWTNPYTASEIKERDILTVLYVRNFAANLLNEIETAANQVNGQIYNVILEEMPNAMVSGGGAGGGGSSAWPADNPQPSPLSKKKGPVYEGQITDAGRAEILAACLEIEDSPEVVEIVNAVVDRWNHSIEAWNSGYFTAADAPEGYDTNFIQIDTNIIREFYELNVEAVSQGYANIFQRYNASVDALQDAMEEYQENLNSSSLCATVTVQFKQKMTMTREAFEGTLTIDNGHESNPIQDIDVDFVIRDENGVDCTNLFQINFLSYDNMTGTNGNASLDAQSVGSIIVQFIPTKQAAPEIAKVYSFGGALSFIDPFTGELMKNDLYPVDIWVHPSPDLYVNYFMQRDILGDDPLTEERVEPIVPAELGVIIHNRGAGTAKNVILETAEPQIIDNEKGLAVDFAMYGAAFNGNERQLGLMAIPFGNIDPNRAAVGEWWFTSTLLGHFISYEAHVIHNSSFGNPDLSLVSSLEIHPLIHTVYAYGNLDDGINDFLVDDVDDYRHYPDSLYFSNGSRTAVAIADSISFDHYVTPVDTIVQLTLDPSRIGWNYEQTWDPGLGQYKLISCTRNSDQQVIPLSNVWQSFVTLPVGGDPVYENRLHIVDTLNTDQPTTYTLVFSLNDLVLEVDTILDVPDSIITAPLSEVTVKFNKPIVDSTFSHLDMSLKCNNGENLLDENLNVERMDSVTYTLHLEPYAYQSGYYVLIIQTLDITDADGFNGYYAEQATWIQNINTCQPDSVSISATACDSYQWAGVTYYESGDITRKFYNTVGCDSVVTLHLILEPCQPDSVVVTITGHHKTTSYDGAVHTATGYDVAISNPLYTEADFTFSGDSTAARAEIGTTYMGLSESQFANTNPNFGTVTFNVTDGYQTIVPADVVVVTITGHHDAAVYDGEAHSMSGYDVEIGSPLYTEADFTFNGTSTAQRTDAGTTNMGLAADQFTNTSTHFESVLFDVTDGYQTITPRSVTLTSASETREYNGNWLTNHNVTVDGDGFITGEGVTYNVTGKQLLPGSSDNTFTYTLNSGTLTENYVITRLFGTLTVESRPVADRYVVEMVSNTTPVSIDEPIIYDGLEHTIEGFVTHTFTVDGNTYTVGGLTANRTEIFAGTYENTITGDAVVTDTYGNDVTAQFDVHFTPGTLTISKRPITFTMANEENATKIFNGTPLTVTFDQLDVEGLASTDTLVGGVITTDDSEVGEYPIADGNMFHMMLTGSSIKSGFKIKHASGEMTKALASYAPSFLITLTINPVPACQGVTYQGHVYEAVQIGSQCWFKEDLRIPIGDHHYYKEDLNYFEKFGYLYSWYTAVGVNEGDNDTIPPTLTADDGTPYVQGICPAGWAVPSMADIAELDHYVGTTAQLKNPSNDYWLPGFEGMTDGTGFNARGCGWYNAAQERYEDLMTGYHFWASDQVPGAILIYSACIAYYCDTIILTDPNQKNDRKSVRCIRKVAP